jgi:hypothetical protein
MGQVSESSVVFNLAEIMRLEAERVAAEQAAAAEAVARAARERERRLALEQEEAACMRAQALAREVAEREQSERRAREHQEALLRIRLDAEAAERLERERLALEHTRTCERIARQARSERRNRTMWLLGPAFALAGAVATYAGLHAAQPPRPTVIVPAPRSAAVAPPAVAGAPSLPAASALRGPVEHAVATPTTPNGPRDKARTPRVQPRPVSTRPAIIGDVEADDDDPLLGILDEPAREPRATVRPRRR